MKCEYSKRECFYTPVATAFSCYLCAVHDAYKQGTADANANRPNGEWKIYVNSGGTLMRQCMRCGHEFNDNSDAKNFCPNCGADMRTQNDRSWDTSERGASGSVENSITQKEGETE